MSVGLGITTAETCLRLAYARYLAKLASIVPNDPGEIAFCGCPGHSCRGLGETDAPMDTLALRGDILHGPFLTELMEIGQARHLEKGAMLFHRDDPGEFVFVLTEGLIEMICLPSEIDRLAPDHRGTEAKLLFSIKESIYKCLWPTVREFIEFQEMELDYDEATGRYRATPRTDKVDARLAEAMIIGTLVSDTLVISTACIEAAE